MGPSTVPRRSWRAAAAYLLVLSLSVAFGGCKKEPAKTQLVVLHAGSLAVPFTAIEKAFEAAHPDVDVVREAAGSRACARKISDLGRKVDVFASADVSVIDTLLIPKHATWSIPFASNEMVVAFTPESKKADVIDTATWYQVLQAPEVNVGRSDPEQDPCGYRTMLTLSLAELHYDEEGLAKAIADKSAPYVRPKETDLLALLEVGELDYIFIYRSVAKQHGLSMVTLPDDINLGNPAKADFYGKASLTLTGKTPGEKIVRKGAPMVYGVTIPTNAPQPALAKAFVAFLLAADAGMATMEANGQPSLVPAATTWYDAVPEELSGYVTKAK